MIERVANPAIVLFVDRRGRILLQHRDANALRFPNLWGLVGGAIEEGESPEEAARREVYEETGLTLTGMLTPFKHFTWSEPAHTWYVFAVSTDANADDLVLGEGQELRFVPPSDVFALDLVPPVRMVLTEFLASPVYARLGRPPLPTSPPHKRERGASLRG
jgi:8-oxo-dGTP diphosphatase